MHIAGTGCALGPIHALRADKTALRVILEFSTAIEITARVDRAMSFPLGIGPAVHLPFVEVVVSFDPHLFAELWNAWQG